MPCFRFASACAALLALASLASAQQGAASYGQSGGQGGSGGGGSFGGGSNSNRSIVAGTATRAPSIPEQDNFVDEDARDGLWTNKSAILTPGDQYQIKLKLRKGETVLAGVVSDAFDPALELDDAKRVAIAKNDDRADGEQSPYISFRVSEAGDYTLKVLSYRSISGGKFTIRMRTFVAMDPGLGAKKTARERSEQEMKSPYVVFLLHAKKGVSYDVRSVTGHIGNAMASGSFYRIYGPTGLTNEDVSFIPVPNFRTAFTALKDGDYYVEYASSGEATAFDSNFSEIKVNQMDALGKLALPFEPEELQLVDFPTKAEEIIQTHITTTSIEFLNYLEKDPAQHEDSSSRATPYENGPDWMRFIPKKSLGDVVRVFHKDGTFRIAIVSTSSKPETITVDNSQPLSEWKEGTPCKGSLEIGESRLVLLKTKKSELMDVQATAEHFEPKLEIFNEAGYIENTLINQQTHKPSDELYFPEEKTYIIRFTCMGDGGSGDYALKRNSPAPEAYKLGSALKLELTGTNFGYYSIELEGGKQYELLYDNTQLGLRADLLDDDGTFLTSQYINFGNIGVQYFTPQHKGHYRLWLRGGPGSRTFKFQVHVIPTLKS